MPSLNRLYLTKFPFDADSSHQSIPQPYSSSSDTSHRPLRAHHYSMAGRKDQTSKPIEAQFSQILKDASSLYSEASGEKLNDYLNPPLKSIDALMRQLDKQNEQFTKFREKRKTLFGALAAALTPVEVIGGIVAGAAAEMFEPADSIFGAVCYLINAARDVSAAYDTIVELFEQLKVSRVLLPLEAVDGNIIDTFCRTLPQGWMSMSSTRWALLCVPRLSPS